MTVPFETMIACPRCRRPEAARLGKSFLARCGCCGKSFTLIGEDRRRVTEADAAAAKKEKRKIPMKTTTKTKLGAAVLALLIAAPAVAGGPARRGLVVGATGGRPTAAPSRGSYAHHSRVTPHCGAGRWVNGYWSCPETDLEASLREIAEAQREMARQARAQAEALRAQQQAAPAPQVIVVPQYAPSMPVRADGVRPSEGRPPVAPTTDTMHRRQDSNGVWHFSNVQ